MHRSGHSVMSSCPVSPQKSSPSSLQKSFIARYIRTWRASVPLRPRRELLAIPVDLGTVPLQPIQAGLDAVAPRCCCGQLPQVQLPAVIDLDAELLHPLRRIDVAGVHAHRRPVELAVALPVQQGGGALAAGPFVRIMQVQEALDLVLHLGLANVAQHAPNGRSISSSVPADGEKRDPAGVRRQDVADQQDRHFRDQVRDLRRQVRERPDAEVEHDHVGVGQRDALRLVPRASRSSRRSSWPATTSCFRRKCATSRSWNIRQSFSVAFATRARPSVKVTIPIFMADSGVRCPTSKPPRNRAHAQRLLAPAGGCLASRRRNASRLGRCVSLNHLRR